jgi:hypothetical protein
VCILYICIYIYMYIYMYVYNLPFSSNVASWEKNRTIAGGFSIAAFDYQRVGDLYNMY